MTVRTEARLPWPRIAPGLRWAAGVLLLACPLAVAGWSLAIKESSIGLVLPDIRSGPWLITGSRAEVRPSVSANGRSVTLSFATPSRLLTNTLNVDLDDQALTLENLRTDLSNTTVTIDYAAPGAWAERMAVEGDVRVDVARLEHPFLAPQSWTFDGQVAGRLDSLQIQGRLDSAAGLTADLDIRLRPEGGVEISVVAVLDGSEDLNALADTITVWPDLLTLDSGGARLAVDLALAPAGDIDASARAQLQDISGVFNRTAVTSLAGEVRGRLEQGRITAGFREMTVARINPGIAVSEVRFSGDYGASAADPLAGSLDIQRARARFLEGELRVPPGTYPVAAGEGRVPVELQGVSLGRLMEVYPAEGLAGTGTLEGRIPIGITSAGGVQVSGGRVSAVAPGGRLQLPADKLQAMLGGNQAMDLVVQALQNFHYSVLNSTIDYDEQGKLTLGLRLEGKNPELRGGQPVVLNVNLEEDIPALLTSLQLSGRVNEAVTRRVRELLQQSGEETAP